MAPSIAPAATPDLDRIASAPAVTTIGSYLIDRLHAMGVDHVFGIPGDYILTLYKMLEDSPIEVVGMTREDGAGFAADAYARIKGLGCVCVTYCVGGLSLVQQHRRRLRREERPSSSSSGAPGVSERGTGSPSSTTR